MNRLLKTLPLFALLAAALTAEVALAQQQLVNVVFSNQTNRPAQVLWVNGARQQKYLDLQPGESQTLQSFVGHSWMVAGPEGAMGRTITRPDEVFTFGAEARPAPIVPEYTPAPRPAPAAPVDPRGQFPLTFNGPFQPQQPQPFQPQQGSSVNQGIVSFAQSVLGQRIGNGQCTELAIAALRAAGAKPNQGYVWGTTLSGPEALQAGDIIQMFDARFVYADGRQAWSTGPHTAVVTSVEGTLIRVLEQNIGGSPVREGSYDVRAMTAGQMEYYRPRN